MIPRPLDKVIKQVLEIAPDLEPHMRPILQSIPYTAPEVMQWCWADFQSAMNAHAINHPKIKELMALVNCTPLEN